MKYQIITLVVILVIAGLSCKEIQGPQGPPGPPGTGLESLTDPAVMPKVITTYPPANSEGPYPFRNSGSYYYYQYSQIQVRFNKIMDRFSVLRAIKLSSPSTHVKIDTNLTWLGGDEFSANILDSVEKYYGYYVTSHRWKVGETYTLTIDTTAKDINGNSILTPYVMTFKPEPYFRVIQVRPDNNASLADPSPTIDIQFNSMMDSSILSSIHLEPETPGRWHFPGDYYFDYTDYRVSFVLWDELGLNNNTNYTITVNSTAHDIDGNQIKNSFQSQFSMIPFSVINSFPKNGDEKIDLNDRLAFSFAALLDTGTIRSSFIINPPTSGYFYFSSYERSYFSFSPNIGFIPESTYTVTIDTSIRSARGGRLSEPYTISFRTEAFSILGANLVNGQTHVPTNLYSIRISASSVMDTSTIRNAFSAPGINGNLSFYNSWSEITYYPTESLSANTTYTITLSTALKCRTGSPLKTPYSFSFTTGN